VVNGAKLLTLFGGGGRHQRDGSVVPAAASGAAFRSTAHVHRIRRGARRGHVTTAGALQVRHYARSQTWVHQAVVRAQSWTRVHFLLTQSNPVDELMDTIQSNPIWMSTTYIQSNP